MKKQKLQTLKGFRDFLPEEMIARQWLLDLVRSVFESWGYDPLETPTLESLDLFAGQIGEDEKLFFSFKDQGGRQVALRYDQTVPLCRVAAQYGQQLPMPFRRYQIQSAFRAEKPQKGRYREFLQCDADILGETSPIADAETIAVGLDVYRKAGFEQVVAKINDRALLKDLPYEAVVAIDKLAKIGEEGVLKEMEQKGIELVKARAYLKTVRNLKPNERLEIILSYLKKTGFDEDWFEFDPTIARSFAYSDGPIWEIKVPGFSAGSVLGGERYDGLTKAISGVDIAGTGFGLGFDRTLEAAQQFDLVPKRLTTTKALLVLMTDVYVDNALELADKLRQNAINVEIFPSFKVKLGKQFKYADKKGIGYVLVLGEEEIKQNKVTLRDMKEGEQTMLNIVELIIKLKADK